MHPAYKTFYHLTGEQFQIIETCNAVKMRLKIDHVYGLGFTVCNSQSQFTVLCFLKIAHCYCKLLTAQEILKTKELSAKILADNCGQDFDKVMKDFNRDHWMGAEESVAYGIVDGIL
jgi:hypothetical protein